MREMSHSRAVPSSDQVSSRLSSRLNTVPQTIAPCSWRIAGTSCRWYF
jgi:hypothetical protein